MTPEHYDNTKALLDKWADYGGVGNRTADGAPQSSPGAPDARIQSLEDLEIEVDKRVVDIVNTAVYDLPVLERDVILMHYGLMRVDVWRYEYTTLFDLAVGSMYEALRQKLAC